jgi:hypothetical protein
VGKLEDVRMINRAKRKVVLLFVFSFAVSLFCLSCQAIPKNDSDDLEKFLKEYEAQKKSILKVLEDEELWKAKKGASKVKLLDYIEAAAVLRDESFIPALVEHIDYDPWGPTRTLERLSEGLPTRNALVKIGLAAVPHLLKVIKSKGRDNPEGGFYGAVLCLADIYAEGGCGPEMAKHRVELEMKKASDKEKRFLKEALTELEEIEKAR